jgi:S-(hydroxymethyl)glutathione dehydrogenase/alcohol dehydrogenase
VDVRKMKAAILVAQHRPLVIDEVELPDRLEAGQVLVRVAYSGICGSQVGEIDGVKGPDAHLPHLLGHEGTGTVIDVGPGVTRVARGEHVVLHWRKTPGDDSKLPRYRWRGAALGAGWVTTFNEYAVVSVNRVTPIPADFDGAAGVLLGCAATTGLGVIDNDAAVAPGESVVVIGCGGVGSFVIQGAAIARARTIVAVDRGASKLALAKTLGATAIVDAAAADVDTAAAVRALLPEGADVVVENTGRTDLIEMAYELCAPQGRAVLVGVPRAGERARIDTLPLHFGKRLVGSHGGACRPDLDVPRCVELARSGALLLSQVVTDRVTLDEVNEGVARLREGKVAGRCLVAIAAE